MGAPEWDLSAALSEIAEMYNKGEITEEQAADESNITQAIFNQEYEDALYETLY